MKTCIKCHHDLPFASFGRTSWNVCKACRSARNREYERVRKAKTPHPRIGMVSRVGIAVAKAFDRGVCESFMKRPVCPSCGRVPSFGKVIDWAVMWGHRCPHGEPCPGWEQVPEGVSTCREQGCKCSVKVKVVA